MIKQDKTKECITENYYIMANENGHGGARQGSGRKKKADENRVRDLATAAIVSVYGNEHNGFVALLKSGDAALVKWVFEHANGKPTDKLDVTTRTEETRIVDVDDDGDEMIDGDPDGNLEDRDYDDLDETPYDEQDETGDE